MTYTVYISIESGDGRDRQVPIHLAGDGKVEWLGIIVAVQNLGPLAWRIEAMLPIQKEDTRYHIEVTTPASVDQDEFGYTNTAKINALLDAGSPTDTFSVLAAGDALENYAIKVGTSPVAQLGIYTPTPQPPGSSWSAGVMASPTPFTAIGEISLVLSPRISAGAWCNMTMIGVIE